VSKESGNNGRRVEVTLFLTERLVLSCDLKKERPQLGRGGTLGTPGTEKRAPGQKKGRKTKTHRFVPRPLN